MNDQIRDITNALLAEVAAELGASYKQLAYVEDVEKNNFRTNNDRYGIRALGGNQTPGVTKQVTISHQFELILSKGYYESNIDDSNQVSTSLDLRELTLDIYKRLVNNRGGLPGTVLNIYDLNINPVQYITESKVAIQRSVMTITYRYSLI